MQALGAKTVKPLAAGGLSYDAAPCDDAARNDSMRPPLVARIVVGTIRLMLMPLALGAMTQAPPPAVVAMTQLGGVGAMTAVSTIRH